MYGNVGFQWSIANFIAPIFAMIQEVFDYLTTGGYFYWFETVDGQLAIGNIGTPALTQKGQDIIGAVMTIVHNGLVFVAQISTLLPAPIQ